MYNLSKKVCTEHVASFMICSFFQKARTKMVVCFVNVFSCYFSTARHYLRKVAAKTLAMVGLGHLSQRLQSTRCCSVRISYRGASMLTMSLIASLVRVIDHHRWRQSVFASRQSCQSSGALLREECRTALLISHRLAPHSDD